MFFSPRRRLVNADGTRNVFCIQCKADLGTVSADVMINTALCVICQAENRGEVLPAHVKLQLRTKTLAVTYSGTDYDPIRDQQAADEADASGAVRKEEFYFFKVVTAIKEAVKKLTKPKVLPSKQLARDKRRPRVFDQDIDLD